jgi:hypothetical protein
VTAVDVFVDDAIRGDLPLVCAKTGEPADLLIRMRQPVGGGIQSITVSIDVTRRWVTLANVHPAFVQAIQRQKAGARRY